MSRHNIRRLTAGLLFAALLGLAAPAMAAPPGWSLPTVALGPAWVDQVLGWIGRLLLGEAIEEQSSGTPRSGSMAKDKPPSPGTEDDTSIAIDPNGCK